MDVLLRDLTVKLALLMESALAEMDILEQSAIPALLELTSRMVDVYHANALQTLLINNVITEFALAEMDSLVTSATFKSLATEFQRELLVYVVERENALQSILVSVLITISDNSVKMFFLALE